jgi:hypothetical protein
MLRGSGKVLLFALALAMWPGVAAAQSQFTGLVTDESGAALPGVTVEVANPVLIEKVRSAVTDGTGRYTIVDLRPGIYKLTYAARHAPHLFAMPWNCGPASCDVNVEMKVGSLEESITVSGQTPVVDWQAARTVLGRDLIDELPTTRSIQSVGQMIPGVRLSVPDVGGERILEPPEMRTHGVGGSDQTMVVDGMSVLAADGGALPYMNDQMEAEVSVRTSAIPAEISAAGVNINSIPKDGGNVFTGAAFLGGSSGSWQSDNKTRELEARGLRKEQDRASDLLGVCWRTHQRNRAWFFAAARRRDESSPTAAGDPDGAAQSAVHGLVLRQLLRRLGCGRRQRTDPVGLYLRDAMIRA